MTDFSEGDNIIDSRDVIKRIEELESDREALACQCSHCDVCDRDNMVCPKCDKCVHCGTHVEDCEGCTFEKDTAEWDDSDDGEELKTLKSLADEGESSADWIHGETLIADHYFEQYAQELAEDIGAIGPKGQRWPFNHIDWAAAADELKQDYTSITFGSTEYWIRS